jgi:hypothetical protein
MMFIADFRRLPMELKLTLLLNQPELPAKLRRFWQASNFRILRVPGNGGALQSVACSKALFLDRSTTEFGRSRLEKKLRSPNISNHAWKCFVFAI